MYIKFSFKSKGKVSHGQDHSDEYLKIWWSNVKYLSNDTVKLSVRQLLIVTTTSTDYGVIWHNKRNIKLTCRYISP